MKRAWLILLLLIVICSYTFGYIIVYEEAVLLIHYRTQFSLRENLESKVIIEIELPHNITNISYLSVNDDELIYYGKIYDIIWVERSQNGRKFYCIYDDSENQLRDLLNDVYSDNPSTNNSKAAKLKFILSRLNLQYTFSNPELLLEQPVLISVLFLEDSSLVFTFLCGDTPPPKT